MKKAPKKYNKGGGVKTSEISPELRRKYNLNEQGYTMTPTGDRLTGTPGTPNPNYPSAQEQQGFSKPVVNRTFTNTGGERNANLTLDQAGTQQGKRKVDILSSGLTMVTNADGSVQYFNAAGKEVPMQMKARGGEIKKMKRVPKKYGGKIC